MLDTKAAQPDRNARPEGGLDHVLGAEIYDRQSLAPPRLQRVTSDGGVLVFWTGRK